MNGLFGHCLGEKKYRYGEEYLTKYFPSVLSSIIIQYCELKGVLEHTIEGHEKDIFCLAIIPSDNNEYVISGSSDNTLKIWDMQTYQCIRVLRGHSYAVTCVAVFNEELIVSGDNNGSIMIWNVKNYDNALIRHIKGHTDTVKTISFVSKILMVSGSNDGKIKIWNLETKSCLLTLCDHKDFIRSCVVFSNEQTNDNRILQFCVISGADDKLIKIWNIKNENDKKLKLINSKTIITETNNNKYNDYVTCVRNYSNKFIMSGSSNGKIKLWNAKTLNCELSIHAHDNWIRRVATLPDGRIISASDDMTLKVWNVNNDDKIHDLCDLTLVGHKRYVYDIVVLSDGRIVSCSSDKTIKVWV
jgi:WD40 repeat protein